MICADCIEDRIKRPPERQGGGERRKVKATGILKKTDRRVGELDRRGEDDRGWPQDRPGYWKEREQLNLQAVWNTGQHAIVIFQGHSLCAKHFAKRKLEVNQDEYGQSRRETV